MVFDDQFTQFRKARVFCVGDADENRLPDALPAHFFTIFIDKTVNDLLDCCFHRNTFFLQNTFQTEGWGVFFTGRAELLTEAVFDIQFIQCVKDSIIFFLGQATADFREIRAAMEGSVLTHDTDQNIIQRQILSYPAEDVDGVLYAARHDHVADDETFFQHTAFVVLHCTNLPKHFQNGGSGSLRIIGGVGITQGTLAVQIF